MRTASPHGRRRHPRPGDRRRLAAARGYLRNHPLAVALGLLLLLVLAPLVVLNTHLLRPLVETLAPRAWRQPLPPPRPGVEESVLRREREGLKALLLAAEHGGVFPPLQSHALVAVDQSLVQRLLDRHVPSRHLVGGLYDVRLEKATAVFESGFALVRLQGRVSFARGRENVFADLTVLGDLSVPAAQRAPDVLQADVNVIAVDARRVTVGLESREAEKLVEQLGRQQLQDFASLLPALQVPVRHQYEITVPAAGRGHSVEIPEARLPVSLHVLQASAFAGKLWVLMAARAGEDAAVPPPGPAASAPPLPPADGLSLAVLRQEHEALHQRLDRALLGDLLVKGTRSMPGDVVIALGAGFLRDTAGELARRYFDEVHVDLPRLDVDRAGELHRDTFLGRVHAGDWKAHIDILDARGRLRAGVPTLGFAPPDVVEVSVPVSIRGGQGAAEVAFDWDSRGITKLICRDFSARRRVSGLVRGEDRVLRGRFRLEARGEAILATPHFERRHHLELDLDGPSWTVVRAALEEQDRVGRCGLVLDPARAEADLRALVARGIDVKLPRKIFRTVSLPTSFATSVEVGGREVSVGLGELGVRLSPEVLWFGATVAVGPGRVESGP